MLSARSYGIVDCKGRTRGGKGADGGPLESKIERQGIGIYKNATGEAISGLGKSFKVDCSTFSSLVVAGINIPRGFITKCPVDPEIFPKQPLSAFRRGQ